MVLWLSIILAVSLLVMVGPIDHPPVQNFIAFLSITNAMKMR
jgi:hypothetical protein